MRPDLLFGGLVVATTNLQTVWQETQHAGPHIGLRKISGGQWLSMRVVNKDKLFNRLS